MSPAIGLEARAAISALAADGGIFRMPGQALPQRYDLADEFGEKAVETPRGALDELRREIGNENIGRDLQSTIAKLNTQAMRYETAIDQIAQGVCFFDSEQRLILCNRRFAEIYSLQPDDVGVGRTLREIVERRYAVGACSGMALEEYLSLCDAIGLGLAPDTWAAELKDGRTILIHRRP